jgi:hypothetical protein
VCYRVLQFHRTIHKSVHHRHICYLFTATFYVHVTVHLDKFPFKKPTRCTNFSNLFWNENMHVSGSSSVHHHQLFTVHTALVYIVQVCRQLSNRPRLESCLQTCMTYTTAECTVNNCWWWTENCPKHVEFHSKINLRILCIWLVFCKEITARCSGLPCHLQGYQPNTTWNIVLLLSI